MPQLIIQNDQSGATGREYVQFDDGTTPTEMLMQQFPDGINPESTVVHVRSQKMELGDNPSDDLFKPLFNNDVVFVVNEVKGLEIIALVIAVVAAVISIALVPKIPGNVGQRKDSPNNNLQGQTNIARPYQAYPLIFGSPRAYPDLTGEPIIEYINNIKQITQLMNIGVGTFDITAIRAGDTPLGNFTGATSTIFEPISKVVTVPSVTNVFATNEVDGQLLNAAEFQDTGSTFNLTEEGTGLTAYVGTTFTSVVEKNAGSDNAKSAFDAATSDFFVRYTYRADFGAGLVFQSGIGKNISFILDGTNMFYTITIVDFDGPKSIDDIYLGSFDLTEQVETPVVIGPLGLAAFAEQIWFNITFPRGLKGTADIRVDMQRLDGPNGDPIVGPQQAFLFSFTEDTDDPQFRTFKGILNVAGFYRFEISRTSLPGVDANDLEETRVEAAFAVTTDTNATFGNNTLIEVVVPATINATSLRENQINLSLTSKLITYNGVNVVTTPAASRKMADALLHLYVDFFGLDSNTLALDELYEIQNRLDLIDPRLATFDFTFDDLDVSLDERMDAILNVARCYKWLDGDVYRFARDEERANASSLITRRDLAADEDRDYSLSYNPQLLEAFDSVKVEFVDKATNKKAYIFRKIDPASGDPQNPTILNIVGRNPKTMELAGCSEEFNAINRAELEIRKLIYQRFVLTDTGLPSMMLLDRGDMVLYAEQYTSDLFDGEILEINGNIATTSESIDFSVGTLFLHYMLDDGTKVGPFSISEVVGEPFQFNSNDLAQAFVRDSTLGTLIQTGSRYIIGQTVDLDASRWTVVEKEARGNNVNLTLVTYDERTYDFDS